MNKGFAEPDLIIQRKKMEEQMKLITPNSKQNVYISIYAKQIDRWH